MRDRRLILTPEALDDLRAARQWYEQRRAGLGAAFELAIEATLTRVQRLPEGHPVVTPPFRRANVRRFPYTVLYRVDPEAVVVALVFHTAQDPVQALSRLRQH
jgi:plasmid stabilization system protein ParE